MILVVEINVADPLNILDMGMLENRLIGLDIERAYWKDENTEHETGGRVPEE